MATDGENSGKVHLKKLGGVERNPCVDSGQEHSLLFIFMH